jgi:hypothetical protein
VLEKNITKLTLQDMIIKLSAPKQIENIYGEKLKSVFTLASGNPALCFETSDNQLHYCEIKTLENGQDKVD